MTEVDLYQPVKNLVESMGFHVKGEVGPIDVFGFSLNQSIAVELKLNISLKLIYQAVERQKIANIVYVAVPKDALKSHRKQYRSFINLLKRLHIGLMVIDCGKASITLESDLSDVQKNTRKTKKIITEFNQRQNDLNTGGTKEKRITHYKENVVQIAFALSKFKKASPKTLKEHTGINKTSSILQKNYDSWFERVDRGIYILSSKGEAELEKYIVSLDLK